MSGTGSGLNEGEWKWNEWGGPWVDWVRGVGVKWERLEWEWNESGGERVDEWGGSGGSEAED